MSLQLEYDSTNDTSDDSGEGTMFGSTASASPTAKNHRQPTQHDLRLFLDNLGNPVLLLDGKGKIDYANPYMISIIAPDKDDISDLTMEKFVHPRDQRKYQVWMDVLSRGHKVRTISLIILDYSGQQRNFEVQAVSSRSGENSVQIQAIFYEILEKSDVLFQDNSYTKVLAEYEEVLGKTDSSQGHSLYMQDKLAGLGHLAAGIAHELRTPLSTLGTSIYYLSKVLAASENESIRDHLRIMQSEIERSQLIISNLVDFSRRSSTERESADINNIVRQTLSLVEKNLAYQDIEVQLSLGSLPRCFINIDEIKQVFLDIVVNSMDAMPNGGCLRIESAPHSDSMVAIRICDNGIGIDSDHLGQIFNPFYSTKLDGGIGLGLSLVHSCIQRNHGSIEVESSKGRGSQFTVFLPVSHGRS